MHLAPTIASRPADHAEEIVQISVEFEIADLLGDRGRVTDIEEEKETFLTPRLAIPSNEKVEQHAGAEKLVHDKQDIDHNGGQHRHHDRFSVDEEIGEGWGIGMMCQARANRGAEQDPDGVSDRLDQDEPAIRPPARC
jgi:hypothetical protein